MKIIVSRKSMDAQCGGLPSPVLETRNGLQFFPLPIPYLHSNLHYRDLVFYDAVTAWDFIKDVAPNYRQEQTCHLDPDLRPNYVRHRHKDWQPAFGQVSAAQKHLQNNGVGRGDLFLFFGWFQFAERKNGKFSYKKSPHFPSGFHAIYGYLQIGEIYKPNQESVPAGLQSHPHVAQQEHGVFKKSSNTVYTATEHFLVEGEPISKSGAGWFPFHENLILTKRGSANRTLWQLPHALHPDNGITLSYHAPKCWARDANHSFLRSASQGQEFIFTEDKTGAAKQWATTLIKTHAQRC